jgi:stress response protein YsnF
MVVPVLREEEVIVVEKRMMLVEEVRITKRQVETSVNQHIKLRKEEVTVERVDGSGTTVNPEADINIKPKEQTNQTQTE